jgi:bacterioferritin
MNKSAIDQEAVIKVLNAILEAELAGVVRYTHYAFMVFGYNRLPIVAWLHNQATESLTHANEAGEMITHLGGHPSLGIGSLLETHRHDIGAILRESLEHETQALIQYHRLLKLVNDKHVLLEEYARRMCALEETHLGDVQKMLLQPSE